MVGADLRSRGRLRDGAAAGGRRPRRPRRRLPPCRRRLRRCRSAQVRRAVEIQVDTVVSRGFGVLAVNSFTGRLVPTWLVHRNDRLPVRTSRSFGTVRADQDAINVTVVEQQGQVESERVEDAKVLIEGEISGIPPGFDEGSEVRVTFEMGFDGVLHVTAFHVEAGIPLELTATTGATLSQAEVAGSGTSWGNCGAVSDRCRTFDPNDYRKRVLAAVEKRGGPETSDPFELYDVPLELELAGTLTDAAVVARVDEVWGFWQRQRDHPKYRVLVGLLVESHDVRSAELRDAGRRQMAALRVRQQREQRDSARFELLDAAIRRLVDRHGGVPRDKIAGLDEVGALTGLTPAEVAARMRRHRVVDAAGPVAAAKEPAIGPERRRQVRALLDEFGRLTDVPPPPTLIALLGLTPESPEPEIRAAAAAWRARARELPPDRLRAVRRRADGARRGARRTRRRRRRGLSRHGGAGRARPPAAAGARRGAGGGPARRRGPRAPRRGGGRARAGPAAGHRSRRRAGRRAGHHHRGVDDAAAGTHGRAGSAARRRRRRRRPGRSRSRRPGRRCAPDVPSRRERLVAEARRYAGSSGTTPIRAVADEVEAVLTEARVRARAASAAVAARRFVEALDHLDHLARTASDLGEPADAGELRRRAQDAVAAADRAVATAGSGPVDAAGRRRCGPCWPRASITRERSPRSPPSPSEHRRGSTPPATSAATCWCCGRRPTPPASSTACAGSGPDGSWRVVGRVHDTSIEDGGAPPGVEPPVYAVSAVQDGRSSAETRSDGPAATAGRPRRPRARCRVRHRPGWSRPGSPTVRCGSAGSRHRATPAPPSTGCGAGTPRVGWRVVGRTRATVIEDGGAPPGPLPRVRGECGITGADRGRTRSCRNRTELPERCRGAPVMNPAKPGVPVDVRSPGTTVAAKSPAHRGWTFGTPRRRPRGNREQGTCTFGSSAGRTPSQWWRSYWASSTAGCPVSSSARSWASWRSRCRSTTRSSTPRCWSGWTRGGSGSS